MQTNQIEAVAKAAQIFGNKAKMARALEITPVTVGQWLKPSEQGGREVPAKQCVRIERLTAGAVTRQALRADDWQDFWPELEQEDHAIAARSAHTAIKTIAVSNWSGVERRSITAQCTSNEGRRETDLPSGFPFIAGERA